MPLLANLVATSQRVASTSGRRSKVQELSLFLKTLPADEIEIAVNYLSGEIPQGKTGIAHKPLRTAADPAEALKELGGEAAFEWKMDGARIQAHKVADEVRIYTRSLNALAEVGPASSR